MKRRLVWTLAVSSIALVCASLCYVWPTPWIYTQDHTRRVNRFTQISEWQYPDGTYKPPQDISGEIPIAQFSLDFLWQSLRTQTLPNDRRSPVIDPPAYQAAAQPSPVLTLEQKRMLKKFRTVRFGMSDGQVRRLLGEPRKVWGASQPDGSLTDYWGYSVGEIEIHDHKVVSVSSI